VAATTGVHSIADDPSLERMTDRSGKYVFCGVIGSGHSQGRQLVDARIVQDGEELEDGKVGEIWLRSGSCGQGYWGMEQRTEETFKARLARPLSPLLDLERVDPTAAPVFMRTGKHVVFSSSQVLERSWGEGAEVRVGSFVFSRSIAVSARRAPLTLSWW
jgi:acyl-CoA synthetase (AMP-forming)/AMP-acid ligase II